MRGGPRKQTSLGEREYKINPGLEGGIMETKGRRKTAGTQINFLKPQCRKRFKVTLHAVERSPGICGWLRTVKRMEANPVEVIEKSSTTK